MMVNSSKKVNLMRTSPRKGGREKKKKERIDDGIKNSEETHAVTAGMGKSFRRTI